MTKDMPLILENDLPMHLGDVGDVDDLFGDGTGLPLRPLSTQFDQRMDDLRNRGCCQTVAWSRQGTIASITPDGQELELRYIRCQPASGEWELSDPTPCTLVKGAVEDPLVHLEWAATNNPELAIFDAAGRVAILIFSITLTGPFLVRKWDPDMLDPTQSIAGCYWLPVAAPVAGTQPAANRQSYNVMFGPAIKNANGTYHYKSSVVQTEGPSHPLQARTALLTVTEGGMLRMFWQNNNRTNEETTLELEGVGSADQVVTHAAFASEKKHLLLAVITSSRQLNLLKIDIKWDVFNPGNNAAPQNPRLKVTLNEIQSTTTSWTLDSVEDGSTPEISHLLTLPSLLDPTGSNMVPPMILSVRSRASITGSFPVAQTTIDRWEAIEQRNGLHSAVEQLGNRRNGIAFDSSSGTRLQALEPIVIPKCVVGLQSSHFGKVIVMAFSDGTVEYRDRFTFHELYTEQDVTTISNLRQAGWNFTNDGICQQVAFSPTFCSMVQIRDDDKIRWIKMCHSQDDLGNPMQNTQYSATVAGLAVTAATSIKYQSNFDDVLAMLRPHIANRQLIQDLVRELIRIVKIQVDYSGEHAHDALMKNDQLRSCLSILFSFGFSGDTHPRSFQSTFALLALVVRSQGWNLTLAVNPHIQVGSKKSPLDDHEVVATLAISVEWSLNLIAWLTDCLFDLMNDRRFMELLDTARHDELATYLHDKNNVALQLLVCSSSRAYLDALCRRVLHLDLLSKKAMEFYRRQSALGESGKPPNMPIRQAYQELQQVTSSCLVSVKLFEELMNQLGAGIMQTYDKILPPMIKKQANPPQGKAEDEAVKAARASLETMMLLTAAPHPSLLPILKKFFNQLLPGFRTTMDPAKLFFKRFEILDVNENVAIVEGVRTSQLSLLTRVKLKMEGTEQWRRCTRCTSVMEELIPGSPPGLTFMNSQQRRCPCSGTWVVLPPGKVV